MAIELSKEVRKEALASLERYLAENFEERVGNIAAGALLSFFVEEVGPLVFNQAVSHVQQHLLQRLQDLEYEIHEDEFQYWSKRGPRVKAGLRGK